MKMTYEQFDTLYDENYHIQDLHAEYILNYADPSERAICNGDTLIMAIEDGYLYEDFRSYYIEAAAA